MNLNTGLIHRPPPSTQCIKVEEGEPYNTKVSSEYARQGTGRDEPVIIYIPNYFDINDVYRVGERLQERVEIEGPLHYKADIYTQKGIYSVDAAEADLPSAARYLLESRPEPEVHHLPSSSPQSSSCEVVAASSFVSFSRRTSTSGCFPIQFA